MTQIIESINKFFFMRRNILNSRKYKAVKLENENLFGIFFRTLHKGKKRGVQIQQI
jgi:hypothetical protein